MKRLVNLQPDQKLKQKFQCVLWQAENEKEGENKNNDKLVETDRGIWH